MNCAKWVSLVLLCLALALPVSAQGITLQQNSQTQQTQPTLESRVYPILLPPGSNVPLSAEYFEMRLGLDPGEIAAITIVSLPQEGSGKLMLDGVEVQVYDTIFRSELDRLCYVQDDNALAASSGWFSFIPLCSSEILGEEPAERVCATFQLRESDFLAQRPVVQDVFCSTQGEQPVAAALSCLQGEVVYTVNRKPLKGTVHFEEGRCVYLPQEGASGADSFELVALDQEGGVSSPITVEVFIEG